MIPRLWAYFILDQILPVSFTQNLFLLATQLSPSSSTTSLRYARPTTHYYLILSYLACLFAAPKAIGTSYFFPVLFATRALLLTPYFLRCPGKKSTFSYTNHALPSEGSQNDGLMFFILSAVVLDVVQSLSMTSLPSLPAINENHAVGALGYDFLIGLGSLIVHWAPV